MTRLTGTLWLLALLLHSGVATCAELRAGAAKSNITPAIGTVLNGGTQPVVSTHVHDELWARALVLDDGQTRLAIVVIDCCLVERPLFDRAKELIRAHSGLDPERVMISCTHTHSGGSAAGAHLSEPDPEYQRLLVLRIADAVRCAVQNLAPARAAWGAGSVPQHVFCRRIRLKPGSKYVNQLGQGDQVVKMNWDSPHPDDLEMAGPVDPELFVLSVRHADGRPLALLASYSLHYVGGVGPGHISADYFGVFAERMVDLLGARGQDPELIACLSNGTSGDINNIDFRAVRAERKPYEQIRRVAEDVAQEALRVEKGLSYKADIPLASAFTGLSLRTRRPLAAEIEAARQLVAGRPARELRTWSEIYAREQLILADYPESMTIPLQVFRVGGAVLAAWPGEIFASTGLELKGRSPVKPLVNIGLANGWYGYIPPPEQHRLGAYETWRGRTSLLEESATVKMLDTLVHLIEKVK